MEEALRQKIDLKTKPVGSLGKLEEIALKMGSIQQTLTPKISHPTILVFTGDHGITEEGVSQYPREVTYQMVMNFIQGGAAINVFCLQNKIRLKVVDAGVDFDFPPGLNLVYAKVAYGTKNILSEPAMSPDTCMAAIEKGKELIEQEFNNGCNTIGFGEMGIGNTSSASLLMHKFTKIGIEECTGRGTGHDDAGLEKKKRILATAAVKHQAVHPLDILAAYGGLEIAMMCGAMLKAREKGMIILVDGFITTAAILAAQAMDPSVLEHAFFCHVSAEAGHSQMLDFLGVEPLVDLGMRLGEGSGAAVVLPIIQSGVNFLNEMASFEDAGVTNKG